MAFQYTETGSLDPCYNLAFEEFLLTNKKEGSWLMLWQNRDTVVVGRNQNVLGEIDADYVRERGITVVRRMTGGGAVYHDLGNLNYSLITDVGDRESFAVREFSEPILRALSALGVEPSLGGRNDISIDGKKVSGVAQRLCGDRILHHGTLLFSSDLSVMDRVLKADGAKLRSKGVKSVRSRVGNIRDFLPHDMTLAEFRAALRRELGADTVCTLTPEELREVERLAERKYRSWDWTYGSEPDYAMHRKARYSGGTLEVFLNVEGGRIADLSFAGDFMALTDTTEAVDALRGMRADSASVLSALRGIRLESIFGSISAEEITKTIFSDTE